MALVERLMGLEAPKIPIHDFFAAQVERLNGRVTRQNIIDALAMNAAAITEYDALVALAPAGDAARALWLEGIHAVFILAEGKYQGYATATAVRNKLGI